MTQNKVLFWSLVAFAVLFLVGALLWYLNGGGAASASGGAVSALLAGLAKQARDKEIQDLKKKQGETQKTGGQALAGADSAIQSMGKVAPGAFKDEDGTGVYIAPTPEDLTAQGNKVFKGGSF
jgi:hypothetical protein